MKATPIYSGIVFRCGVPNQLGCMDLRRPRHATLHAEGIAVQLLRSRDLIGLARRRSVSDQVIGNRRQISADHSGLNPDSAIAAASLE